MQDPLGRNLLHYFTNPITQLTVCMGLLGCRERHIMSRLFTYMLLQGRFAVWTVKHRVETSFDETEFLEGAKDAWVAGDMLTDDVFVSHIT